MQKLAYLLIMGVIYEKILIKAKLAMNIASKTF